VTFWDKCIRKLGIRDPFSPGIPKHLKKRLVHTIPFRREKKER